MGEAHHVSLAASAAAALADATKDTSVADEAGSASAADQFSIQPVFSDPLRRQDEEGASSGSFALAASATAATAAGGTTRPGTPSSEVEGSAAVAPSAAAAAAAGCVGVEDERCVDHGVDQLAALQALQVYDFQRIYISMSCRCVCMCVSVCVGGGEWRSRR